MLKERAHKNRGDTSPVCATNQNLPTHKISRESNWG